MHPLHFVHDSELRYDNSENPPIEGKKIRFTDEWTDIHYDPSIRSYKFDWIKVRVVLDEHDGPCEQDTYGLAFPRPRYLPWIIHFKRKTTAEFRLTFVRDPRKTIMDHIKNAPLAWETQRKDHTCCARAHYTILEWGRDT